MKVKYPEYNQGDIQKIEEKLKGNNKTILNNFRNKCSITANPKKVDKIARLITQFYDITEKDLDKQTKESVDSFLVVLNNSNRSEHTKNEIKSYLKKFLRWQYREKSMDMIENIKRKYIEINSQRINENNLVTEEDVKKLLRCADFKEKAFISLAFESGARPQELLSLTWNDITFNDDYADINLFSKKTRRSRLFPVKTSMQYLKDWKQHYSFPDVKPTDYIFVSRWRDRTMTTPGTNKMLRRLGEEAKITKDFFNYLFRHTRATQIYQDLPTPIVEQLMGHKNMFKVYAHISNKSARDQLLKKMRDEELAPDQRTKYEKDIAELQRKLKIQSDGMKEMKGWIEQALESRGFEAKEINGNLVVRRKDGRN